MAAAVSNKSGSKIKTTKKEIIDKTAAVIADNKNANLLLDILNLNQSDDIRVVKLSCSGLGEIFGHFMSKGFILDSTSISGSSEHVQFASWLGKQFTTTCDILTDNLNHENVDVQNSALNALVAVLEKAEGGSSQQMCIMIIKSITGKLLKSKSDKNEVISQLPSVLAAWQAGVATQEILETLKKSLKSQQKVPSDIYLFNCWRIIKIVTNQKLQIDDTKKKPYKHLDVVVSQFLSNKMSTSLYKEILISVTPVMEKMETPVRLVDFLTESFNAGGAISLMSLQGLFTLMHKYNLDYPDFYKKLYSMFEPQVFGAKYRARFFHLADTFLSSSHLPAYLVAAFAKRLARLCLHAPVSGIAIAIPFILNLISRHPICDVLLHRVSDGHSLDSDPYLAEEEDMSKCNALDSCLWELQTLEHHYSPTLSQKAKKRHVYETELGPLLETTSSDIINKETKKVKENIPVTFIKPSGLELPKAFVF